MLVLRSDGALDLWLAGVVVAVPARVGARESNNLDIVAGDICIWGASCVVCTFLCF